MLFYVEKWIRFIDFGSAYTKTNHQGNKRQTDKKTLKGEIIFSQHLVIPV